ncbi:MAG: ADP-ribosylglycohydrolase family protein [Microbacteriaceae bacterium]|nr:MAG: ADP-ribosylglycohydrolase family protein [Microbacteriaceae bacterium]
MPTQLMSRQQIRERFGVIDGFRAADADHPIAADMPAGRITDDTEQALLLAHALIAGRGHVDPAEFARALIAWEDDMRARGSLDLLGPSTKAAVAAVLAGTPVDQAGRFGTTNGAAMRVTPVGIVRRCRGVDGVRDAGSVRDADGLSVFVDLVVEAGLVSHNTSIAISGAAAVAAAVSAGIDGASVTESIEVAIRAAALGRDRGHWIAGADVSRRIEWAASLTRRDDPHGSLRDITELVGTSLATQESVPAVFGVLALFGDDPWKACCAAASLGGDTDTVAAMVGAIAGACSGMHGLPDEAVATVRAANALDLAPLAERLLELR